MIGMKKGLNMVVCYRTYVAEILRHGRTLLDASMDYRYWSLATLVNPVLLHFHFHLVLYEWCYLSSSNSDSCLMIALARCSTSCKPIATWISNYAVLPSWLDF